MEPAIYIAIGRWVGGATRLISVLGGKIISHNQSAETSACRRARPRRRGRPNSVVGARARVSISHISGLTTHHYLSFFLSALRAPPIPIPHPRRTRTLPFSLDSPPPSYWCLPPSLPPSLAVNVTILSQIWISAVCSVSGGF